MNSQAIAMSRNDNFDVFELWEYRNERWELLLVARPRITIALYWQKPETRLVFPVGFNPNKIGKESLARKKRKYERKKQQTPTRLSQRNIKQTVKAAKNKRANISK